jgi:hypothetical protein
MNSPRFAVAVLAAALGLAPAAEAAHRLHAHHHGAAHHGGGSWDGRWAGAWGGNDPTAVNIRGGRVVSYEYSGQTNPVEWSKVSPSRITYGESNIVVTLTRTGPNTAHATIKTGQGNGTAELKRD